MYSIVLRFSPCISFPLFPLLKNILVDIVTRDVQSKLRVETSTVRPKSCIFTNYEFDCGSLPGVKHFEVSEKRRVNHIMQPSIYLFVFFFFYNVRFLWGIFLLAQSLIFYQPVLLALSSFYIFLMFPFLCLDQKSLSLVN